MSNDTTVYTTYPEAHQDERGRYFDGQFLTSQDFVDEQRYHVDRLRRALDHLTVSGVCEGLDLSAVGPWKIRLAPGVAVDGVGRQLVVLAALAGVDVPKDIPGGVVDVALYYTEIESRIHGGTSDEDGTRGASRWRELPALEFYPAGQPAPHPDGVPLARLRVTGDGAVSFDGPNPVRRASGLRLPSSGPNAPTLRAGFARPHLLALTGDLQITGKLGVGTPDPEGELDVRGLARVGQLSVREQPFTVAGDEASFYPIVFRDLDWTAGQCVLEILRPNSQTDAVSAGSLMARLRWHAADGHGSDLLDVDIVQTRRFVANARLLAKDRLLVVWLRGNRSYAWRAGQRVELVDGNAAAKTFNNEKLDPRTNVEPAFDRDRLRLGPTLDREELRGSVSITGDLAISGQLARLDVAESGAATLRTHDLYLGHSARRGTPGRALVDASKDALYLNYAADWPLTVISSKAQITGDLTVDGEARFNKDVTLAQNLKLPGGGLTVAKPSAFADQVTITRDNEPLRLIRPRSNAGGARMFLELYQEDVSPPTTPDTHPFIRFHHANRYWHRIETRHNGFHLLAGDGNGTVDLTAATIRATGDLAISGQLARLDVADHPSATLRSHDLFLGHSTRRGSPGRALVDGSKDVLYLNFGADWPLAVINSKAQVTGDLFIDGEAKFNKDVTLAQNLKLPGGALTVAKATVLNDTLNVANATTLGGSLTVAKATVVNDTLNVANATTLGGALTVAKATVVNNTLNVASTTILGGTLTVASTTNLSGALGVAKAAYFADNVRVTRDAEHLTLFRGKSATGGAKMFLELYQDDGATPETFPFIRFHHNNRYWHRLEARGNGLHIIDGEPNGYHLRGLHAGDINSNDRPVVTGNTERLRVVRGIVNGSGGVTAGSGFTLSRENNLTKITFNPAFDEVPAVVVTQQFPSEGNGADSGDTRDNAVVAHATKSAAWVKTGNGGGDHAWRKFHFIAVGP